jgi:hypothetical protein
LRDWTAAVLLEGNPDRTQPGSPNMYPPDAVELVRRLGVLADRGERLPGLGWAAWWQRYAVPQAWVRQAFADSIAEAELAQRRQVAQQAADPLSPRPAVRMTFPPAVDRLARRTDIRRWRKNVGDRDEFDVIAAPALERLAYGEQPEWNPEDRRPGYATVEAVLARVANIEHLGADPPDDAIRAGAALTSANIATLEDAGVLSACGLRQALDTLSDEQLNNGRDLVRALVEGDTPAARALAERFDLSDFHLLRSHPRPWPKIAALIVGIAAVEATQWGIIERANADALRGAA